MSDPAAPYRRMAENNAWANETLHAAVAGLDRSAFVARRPGFFPSIGRTLNHIYEVDLYYLDALEAGGLGRSVYERVDIDDPAELRAAQAAQDRRLIAFCAGLDSELLATIRSTERQGAVAEERVDALLLHLFQHQIHHRGQAHVQVQDAGIAPPQLDDFYLDFERADSAQPYFE